MLTPLQERIARAVLAAEVHPDLALAGGGALIALGLVPRTTVDLDFFLTEPLVEELTPIVARLLEGEGLDVVSARVSPAFARLSVSDGADRCQVDIAQDARLWPTQRSELGTTMSTDELAADKTLALFTRAEARDYVDVFFLAAALGRDRLCSLALEKDDGFDEGVFADMLGAIDRLDREEFDVDDPTLERITAFVATWRDELRAR